MGLRASEHKWTLIALYLTTMLMRASFYITIAVIQSSQYLGGSMNEWDVAIVLAIYPLVELSSVSFFGSFSDKIGRRPVFMASLLLTSSAAFLFAVTPDKIWTPVLAAIFGLGAASQVSSTLSIVADCSSLTNRARLMGYYDLSTLMGLAGGYGIGVLLLHYGVIAVLLLLAAAGACLVCSLIVRIAMRETRTAQTQRTSILSLLGRVVRDRRIQKMLPVYIPIISLYGIVIANAENILEEHFSLTAIDLLILFGMMGGGLVLGILVMGHLSDYLRRRRPFIVIGLLGFGLLAFLLVSNAEHFEALWAVWPLLPLLSFTAGSFPPAAMAYLTDVSHADARGSTMGVYSIFFGTGMIIGPSTGALAYSSHGLVGLGILVAGLIAVAIIGTYFMSEAYSSVDSPSVADTAPMDQL